MTAYNGHPSWNCWNVALWIGNDEGLYHCAVAALRSTRTLRGATNEFFKITGLQDCKTKDGGVFNFTATRHALAGLEINQRT